MSEESSSPTRRSVLAATAAAGASYSIPNAYVYCYDMWVLDPNTTANWTLASVNALQAGYELVS